MTLNKLDHIGIAVSHLDNAILTYEKLLGIKCYKTEAVKGQKVITAFFRVGDVKIELISPIMEENEFEIPINLNTKEEEKIPKSSLERFLDSRGEGLHHLAFQVEDIHEEIRSLEEQGFKKIGERPSQGADEKLIQFLHPKEIHGTLIELCSDMCNR